MLLVWVTRFADEEVGGAALEETDERTCDGRFHAPWRHGLPSRVTKYIGKKEVSKIG
jgi:hypothetical protein